MIQRQGHNNQIMAGVAVGTCGGWVAWDRTAHLSVFGLSSVDVSTSSLYNHYHCCHLHHHHHHHRHHHCHIIIINVHISIITKHLTGLKYWLVGYWFAGLIVLPCISLTPDELSLKYFDILSHLWLELEIIWHFFTFLNSTLNQIIVITFTILQNYHTQLVVFDTLVF